MDPNCMLDESGLPLTPCQPPKPSRPFYHRPLSQVFASAYQRRGEAKRFFQTSIGSLLYALSALAIVYGMTQIIGPPLAKSFALADILPCVGVLNIYELALLSVLLLTVCWRRVTHNAVMLVFLMAVFFVASGMTLGTVAPSGLNVCLAIGLLSILLGGIKLFVLDRIIGLPMRLCSLIGLIVLLIWNFLGASLMARPLMAQAATDALLRSQWLWGWWVMIIGAALLWLDAVSKNYHGPESAAEPPPALRRPTTLWLFGLGLWCAMGFHQYGIAYMFAVDHMTGDFLPWLLFATLLALELLRSLGKRFGKLELLIAGAPLAVILIATAGAKTTVVKGLSHEMVVSPPYLLAAGALCFLGASLARNRSHYLYVALAYGLGVLTTWSGDHRLNWELFGAGAGLILFVCGLCRRMPKISFAGVLIVGLGIGTRPWFNEWAVTWNLTQLGGVAGLIGIGTVLLTLIFGAKMHRLLRLLGTVLVAICAMDMASRQLHYQDLLIGGVLLGLAAGLFWRTRDWAAALCLCIPIVPRAYLCIIGFSSWAFIVLSFVLLFFGAAASWYAHEPASEP